MNDLLHPNRFQLQCYKLGELEESLIKKMKSHLGECSRCNEILKNIEIIDNKFLKDHVPEFESTRLIACFKERSEKQKKFLSVWKLIPTTAIFIVIISSILYLQIKDKDEVRPKGTTIVDVYVNRNDKVQRIDANTFIYPGDKLRFSILPSKGGFLTVLTHREILYPSTHVKADKKFALPWSVLIDEKGKSEIFTFILSKKPIERIYVGYELNIGLIDMQTIELEKGTQ